MKKISALTAAAFAGTAALALMASEAPAQNTQGWVAGWAASQQGQAQAKLTNASVRMIARVTIPGDQVRIRLDNTFGMAPVTFGTAMIAPRVRGVAIANGTAKPVTFGGASSVTIPAGGSMESDPVAMRVDAQEDLAVTVFVSGTDVQPSQHGNAQTTSYVTANGAGDKTDSVDGKEFTGKTTAMYWLKAIDVHTTRPSSTIVAFGDSITDGTCTTLDAHDRWEDVVAQRLAMNANINRSVVNEGIGGNTIVDVAGYNPAVNSPPGVVRFDRDVLSHPGVSHVILFLGTNDIRRGATAEQVENGIRAVIGRAKAKGIKVIGVTIVPRHSLVPGIEDTGWNVAKTQIRNDVNAWIKKGAGFDAVLDFDKVVRSQKDPDLLEAAYNCGDGVHPSPIGYFLMGKSVDLALFGK
jgi:lysophospholipase L1-like esterase